MEYLEETKIPFCSSGNYKLGAVTYKVTAHFCPESESLKTKVNRLIISDLHKHDSLCTFAESHLSDVK